MEHLEGKKFFIPARPGPGGLLKDLNLSFFQAGPSQMGVVLNDKTTLCHAICYRALSDATDITITLTAPEDQDWKAGRPYTYMVKFKPQLEFWIAMMGAALNYRMSELA